MTLHEQLEKFRNATGMTLTRKIVGLANNGDWLWSERCECGQWCYDTDNFCSKCGVNRRTKTKSSTQAEHVRHEPTNVENKVDPQGCLAVVAGPASLETFWKPGTATAWTQETT